MQVSEKRWGEITIKKQGAMKNQFDGTKSFSIDETQHRYGIHDFLEVFKTVVNLTSLFDYRTLMKRLRDMENERDD